MISNTTRHKSLATTLVSAPLDPLQSSLQIGSGGGIEKLLLELIYCQRMKTRQDLDSFVVCTLMNVQHPPLQVNPLIPSLSFPSSGQRMGSDSHHVFIPAPVYH